MVRVEVLGSDYFQNKRDVTRMRCTRKYLNYTAHAIDDQNNGRRVSAKQTMIEHTPHAIPNNPVILYRSVGTPWWRQANGRPMLIHNCTIPQPF